MKYMSDTSLAALLAHLTNKFANITHSHSPNDISEVIPVSKGGTGSADRALALNNLVVVPVRDPVSVTSEDYRHSGIYYLTSPTDSPTNGVGYLVTVRGEGKNHMQFWIGSESGKTGIYNRERVYAGSGSVWTSWKHMLTEDDLSTVQYTPTALNNSDVSGCHVYKKAGWVHVTGYVRVLPTSTSAANIQAAQLPDECMPFESARGISYRSITGGLEFHAIEVNASGKLVVSGIVGTVSGSSYERQTIFLAISYPAQND